MGQSTIIIGAILFGFVVFVTVKGELPKYLAIFFGSSNPAPASGPVTPFPSFGGGDFGGGGASSTW